MAKSRTPKGSPVGTIELTAEGIMELSEKPSEDVARLSEIQQTGIGTVTARPNQVTLTIGHRTIEADPAKSQAKNDKTMDAVAAAIKALGVRDEDVKTLKYSVERHYTQVRTKKGKVEKVTTRLTGYETVHFITATSHDVACAGRLLSIGTAKGASENGGIDFSVDPDTRALLKLDAIRAAMQQAKDKVETALAFCGRKIIAMEPQSIDEVGRGGYDDDRPTMLRAPTPMMESYQARPAEAPVEAGSIQVTARVQVLFKF